MDAPNIPPQFKPATWSDVENGQAIWYQSTNPVPMGPWIVVDRNQRLIRPLNSTVHRTLDRDDLLIRPDLPPPKAG